MKWFKEGLFVWKKVFGNPKYLALAILVVFLFYELNVFLTNWTSIFQFYSTFGFLEGSKFLWNLSVGFKETLERHSIISLGVISLMIGILVSLISFKVNSNVKVEGSGKQGVLGVIGVFLAALAPGCAACGIGLASTLGLSAAFLTFLHYNGLEISVLAIAILGFVILKTTYDLKECKACKINLNTS